MNSERIVITGLGLTAPNGNTPEAFRRSLLNGVSGVTTLETRFMGTVLAGVCDFDELKYQGRRERRRGTRAGAISIFCANEALAPYLPGHPVVNVGGEKGIGPVASGPWGSPSILPISWSYIRLMGAEGLRRASEVAILNANYMSKRLDDHFETLYHGENGRVAHEFILDLRPLRKTSGITDEDVAKRLQDYGWHSPTQSFPVIGTLMVEPTESESKEELDRFCDAMILIREEIDKVAAGVVDKDDNVLKNAPHTAAMVTADEWSHPYTRQEAAYPAPWTRDFKFWVPVRRINNAYGDRNLVCACPPMEVYAEE